MSLPYQGLELAGCTNANKIIRNEVIMPRDLDHLRDATTKQPNGPCKPHLAADPGRSHAGEEMLFFFFRDPGCWRTESPGAASNTFFEIKGGKGGQRAMRL
jgi:hypothetical protein